MGDAPPDYSGKCGKCGAFIAWAEAGEAPLIFEEAGLGKLLPEPHGQVPALSDSEMGAIHTTMEDMVNGTLQWMVLPGPAGVFRQVRTCRIIVRDGMELVKELNDWLWAMPGEAVLVHCGDNGLPRTFIVEERMWKEVDGNIEQLVYVKRT